MPDFVLLTRDITRGIREELLQASRRYAANKSDIGMPHN